MQIFSTPESLKVFLSKQRQQDKAIGLVPTMGALHAGHLELVKKCVELSDVSVCSIYVNPTQFNDAADLESYPRDLEGDLAKLRAYGCQVVFTPTDQVMYPEGPITTLYFGKLDSVMEGLHRPGHFSGVALVVSKLFHLVQPHMAFFGAKDWQQLVIIKQMVHDLGFPLKIIDVPIAREPDGLAMSSRNIRLTPKYRKLAPQLFRTLELIKNQLEHQADPDEAIATGMKHLSQFPEIKLEYLEVVNSFSLERPSSIKANEPLSICIAAFLAEIRLIDNVNFTL
jgi:pantoate--beta-alanine ligase